MRVAADEEEHAALLRWAEHAARLSERYAAPPLLDRFVVAGGLPWCSRSSTPPSRRSDLASWTDELLAVLGALHADAELAAALGPPVTAGQAFTNVWISRFVADLAVIEATSTGTSTCG